MIVLDTNVVSALMLRPADRKVRAWLDKQPSPSIWTTSVTVFELRFGLAILPEGRRREALSREMSAVFDEDLQGRILGLGEAEAIAAAELMAARHATGRPSGVNDALIAGVVRVHRATFATRDTRHFTDTGIDLINPWDG